MKGTGDGGETKKSAVIVIWFVGVYGLTSLVGAYGMAAVLANRGKDIPSTWVPILMTLAAGGASAMTGLIGLLGRTSSDTHGTPSDPTSTTIVNKPTDPVPTVDTKKD